MNGSIIAVVGEKGGTGKSTLAQNLGVYFLLKNKDVVLVDTDIPQRTTGDWADTRNENASLKTINIVEKTGNILHTLKDLSNRYAIVIVDCGGHDNEATRSAAAMSTLALFPFRPKRRDLKTLAKMERLVHEAKITNPHLIVRSIITQGPSLPTQESRITEAKAVCHSFGIPPIKAVTFHRNAYDDCEESGMTVLEYSDKKAKHEMHTIGQEIEGLLK